MKSGENFKLLDELADVRKRGFLLEGIESIVVNNSVALEFLC